MRLKDDRAAISSLALATMIALGGCSSADADVPAGVSTAVATPNGPAADYPVLLGDPYTINGVLYTPSDALNHDEVGYVAADAAGGMAITASHRTLPLPSYAEVTSLESGRTVLVRVERRGPMTGSAAIGLSQGARDHLEVGANAPVRIRRVNPPEWERSKLRAGERASERIETPEGLLVALRKRLSQPKPAAIAKPPEVASIEMAPSSADQDAQAPSSETVETAFADVAPSAVPELPPLEAPNVVGPTAATKTPAPAPNQPRIAPQPTPAGDFVVQAGAYSTQARANNVAGKIGGIVSKAGRLFRVRTGPFVSRGEAESALAKVRAAGYSDARIYRK